MRDPSGLRFSAVLLSWRRPHNLPRIVAGLRSIPQVGEILVWNNAPDTPLQLDGAAVFHAPENYRCFPRYCLAALARHDHVWFQDDDVLLSRPQFEQLVTAYAADPTRLYGYRGRRLEDGRYVATDAFGAVDIVLGQTMMFHRDLLPVAFAAVGHVDPRTSEDDIAFSLLLHRPHTAIDVGPPEDLGTTDAVALYRQPGHMERRQQAVEFYSALAARRAAAHPLPIGRPRTRWSWPNRLTTRLLAPDRRDTSCDLLLPRDGASAPQPDLASDAPVRAVPVIGYLEAAEQHEYGVRQRHAVVHAAIERVLYGLDAAIVPIDTRTPAGRNALRLPAPAAVQSLIGRMDFVVTTRLDGLVLALRDGIPALAVDPIAGGGNVSDRARALGWPALLTTDALSDDALHTGIAYCQSPAARRLAQRLGRTAPPTLDRMRDRLLAFLHTVSGPQARS